MNSFAAKLIALILSVAGGALALLPDGVRSERGPPTPAWTPGTDGQPLARVIVKYRQDAAMAQALATVGTGLRHPLHAATLAQRLQVPLADGRVLGPRTQSLHGSGLTSEQLAERLSAMADVEWAVPDKVRTIAAVPNDPLLSDGQTLTTPAAGQWHLRAPDTTIVSAIDAVGAWNTTEGSPAITVAILDTGVLPGHPDLAGKLHPGYDFVQNATAGNDGTGRDADPTDPGDNTTAGECGIGRPAQNSTWHGTQVAGLIGAATDNGLGVAGVGRRVMVLPVRVLGRCGGYDSDIIAAMRWSAGLTAEVGFGAPVTVVNNHPARVINLSLGSMDTCSASYRETIAELNTAGVAVVVAAGNQNGLAVNTPANCPGAIAVAGLRHTGTKVGYSSLGPEVSIAAPAGNCVNLAGTCLYPLVTTTNSGTSIAAANIYSDGSTPSLGTSFSAPLVAGTVALMLSANPRLSPAQVKTALQATARPFPSTGAAPGIEACHAADGADQLECYCNTGTCGAGMLSASLAVTKALEPAVAISSAILTPTVGATITLDGSASAASLGRALVSYAWSITGGTQSAQISGPANGPTLTLATVATGDVAVRLVVTDNLGGTSTGTVTLSVLAAPASSSGGGAWGWDGLLLLAAAAAGGLHRRRTRTPSAYTLRK
jgi:serine protease